MPAEWVTTWLRQQSGAVWIEAVWHDCRILGKLPTLACIRVSTIASALLSMQPVTASSAPSCLLRRHALVSRGKMPPPPTRTNLHLNVLNRCMCLDT